MRHSDHLGPVSLEATSGEAEISPAQLVAVRHPALGGPFHRGRATETDGMLKGETHTQHREPHGLNGRP